MTHLNILFGTDVHLKFRLAETSIAQRWARQLQLAQDSGYQVDDPKRFYGFNSIEEETTKALALINASIDTINNYQPLIEKQLHSVNDQDTLNYLHHVFEVYHGLLDTQHSNKFFANAPAAVQRALADLNIHVHRCESIARGLMPRTVVTYYGLPKTQQFDVIDYLHFTNQYQFGTVYINYVEIGKTLTDLAKDNDQYIADEAFRPYTHFSADFNIRFRTVSNQHAQEERALSRAYYQQHQDWFAQRGYYLDTPCLASGQCLIAKLETTLSQTDILAAVANNQFISKVWLV